jgi:hypothetical protein
LAVTPDEIAQAVTLLSQLNGLRAQQALFNTATAFNIEALGTTGQVIATASNFPASTYLTQVDEAFTAEIATVTAALTALGVTGF